MNLRDFIAQTITEIHQGVQDAISQRSGEGFKGATNPVFGADSNAITGEYAQDVEFDIAVTATETKDDEARGGIRVFSMEIGGKTGKGSEDTRVSRIRFKVPIIPPVQVVRPAPERE